MESSFLLGRDACTNHGRCRLCFRLLARARGCRARVIVTSSLPVPYIPNFAMIVECKRTAYQLGRRGGGGRQRDHDLRARAAFMLGGSGVRKERCSGCLGERSRNVVTYGLRHGSRMLRGPSGWAISIIGLPFHLLTIASQVSRRCCLLASAPCRFPGILALQFRVLRARHLSALRAKAQGGRYRPYRSTIFHTNAER